MNSSLVMTELVNSFSPKVFGGLVCYCATAEEVSEEGWHDLAAVVIVIGIMLIFGLTFCIYYIYSGVTSRRASYTVLP